MFQAVSSSKLLHIHKCLCNSSLKFKVVLLWFGQQKPDWTGNATWSGNEIACSCCLKKKERKRKTRRKKKRQSLLITGSAVGPREIPPMAALPEQTLVRDLWEQSAPPHLSRGNLADQRGPLRRAGKPGQARVLSPPASTAGFQVTKESRVSQRSVTSPGPP